MMRLHYELAGRGLPLVLLPGAAADGSAWRRAGHVDLLADMFACVLIDPPGTGRTERPTDDSGFAVAAIAERVVEVADRLGLERFAVWGASTGASIAAVVAAEYPDRVSTLIMSSSWPADLGRWREDLLAMAAAFREQGTSTVLAGIYDAEREPVPEWVGDVDVPCEVVASIIAGTLDYDWAGRAMPEHIQAPTLMIVGELDDPEQEAPGTAAAMADAEAVVLPGRGHVGAWPGAVEESVQHVKRFVAARQAHVA